VVWFYELMKAEPFSHTILNEQSLIYIIIESPNNPRFPCFGFTIALTDGMTHKHHTNIYISDKSFQTNYEYNTVYYLGNYPVGRSQNSSFS